MREAKGWGQQTLADRAVVSIKTINSVEQGKPAQLTGRLETGYRSVVARSP
jgi:DNA-binding XRE family transcriptional regulator